MKTKKELEKLRVEYDEVCKKMKELTEDELKEVTGGEEYTTYFTYEYVCPKCKKTHSVRLYYNLHWYPFWNDGCLDLTFWYDADLDKGGKTGTLVDRRTYERIPLTLVSATSWGETTIIT